MLLEGLSSPTARSELEDQVRVSMLISDFKAREAESDADNGGDRITSALHLLAAGALGCDPGRLKASPA